MILATKPLKVDSISLHEISQWDMPKYGGSSDNDSDSGVVIPLTSHQCGPRSNPRLGLIRGLSFLVLYSATRGFSPGLTPVLTYPQKVNV